MANLETLADSVDTKEGKTIEFIIPETVSSDKSCEEYVQSIVESGTLVLFSMHRCPSCRKIRALFEELGLSKCLKVFNLDDPAFLLNAGFSAKQIKDHMTKKYEQKTVPSLFVNGVHVGGTPDIINCLAQKKFWATMNEHNVQIPYLGRQRLTFGGPDQG